MRNLFSILLLFLFAIGWVPLGVARPGRHDGATEEPRQQSSPVLATSANRVVFDAAPFSTGSVVPYWDKRYLISLTPETHSPEVPNVRFYDGNGHLVRQSVIWFPEAETVFIISAAASPEGNILASGTAVKADGTRAYFIAGTDAAGKMTEVIQTNPFFPANICTVTGETVWSFGNLGDRNTSNGAESTAGLLRQFDLRRGLVASYLPPSAFGSNTGSPATRSGEGKEVYFRCALNRVVVYSGVSDKYVEFDIASRSARQFTIDRSTIDLPVRGFAVTDKGEVYGYLRDYSKPELQGLFHLDLDTIQFRARWVPIKGASGRKGQHGIISGLYGADGDALVHNIEDDPAGRVGISWSAITSEPAPR